MLILSSKIFLENSLFLLLQNFPKNYILELISGMRLNYGQRISAKSIWKDQLDPRTHITLVLKMPLL